MAGTSPALAQNRPATESASALADIAKPKTPTVNPADQIHGAYARRVTHTASTVASV